MIELRNMKTAAEMQDSALLDLGDGICCLEFRSKGNSITPTIKAFVLELLDKDLLGFDAMVIGSQGKHFSAGADLQSMLDKIERNQFYLFEDSVNYFQQMNYQIKYYHKPIVAAPYGMTLGGGLEIALHSRQCVAREKCCMGLVEVGVGLLPSGGGTKETALRLDGLSAQRNGEAILALYERLLLGTVSKHAGQALQLGYLRDTDEIVSGPELQLDAAKQACMALVREGPAKTEATGVTLPGRAAYALMTSHAERLLDEGKIAPHDLYIGRHIALILAGSTTESSVFYTEQQILDTERECFIDLLRHVKTQKRIAAFLGTGVKLKN